MCEEESTYVGVFVLEDILLLHKTYQDSNRFVWPVPTWIRLGIEEHTEIGAFVEMCEQKREQVEESTSRALVPTFLYKEIGKTAWDDFASTTSYCHVQSDSRHLIVTPQCRMSDHGHPYFRPLLGTKIELPRPLLTCEIGEAISTGAKRSWSADIH